MVMNFTKPTSSKNNVVKNIVAHGKSRVQNGDIYIYNYDEPSQNRCLADLLLTDPRDDKIRIVDRKGGLLKDVYRWILEHKDFLRWRDDKDSRLLWINGDAGKGKTMLLSGIIDELPSSMLTLISERMSHSCPLSFFFCQATDDRCNNATAVLRGLTYRLIRQKPSLISYIEDDYKVRGRELFHGENSFYTLSLFLKSMLCDPDIGQPYIVIDALDECEFGLDRLLNFIVECTSKSQAKWIVSSRWSQIIEQRLHLDDVRIKFSLETNAEQINEAINIYINHKVESLSCLEYDDKLKKQVQEGLRCKADGTFLWVALVIPRLEVAQSWNIKSILTQLPTGLIPLYDQMMERIRKLNHENNEFCQRVLLTVTFAYRPLHLCELGVLSALPEHISGDNMKVKKVTQLCASFLTIRDDYIYLIHQSVKDYLQTSMLGSIFTSVPEPIHHTWFNKPLNLLTNILNLARNYLWPTKLGSSSTLVPEAIHYNMLEKSLELLTDKLQRNIYGLSHLGTLTNSIVLPNPDPLTSTHYACIYWVDHLLDALTMTKNNYGELHDDGIVYQFLHDKFLNWLEALSLLGRISDGIIAISKLNSVLGISDTHLARLVHDAYRFILAHRSAIEQAPLQAYALVVFSPTSSLIRQRFIKDELYWIIPGSLMKKEWNASLILEGHDGNVSSVAWSHDSVLLASASYDGTIKIWDQATGNCIKTLIGSFSIKSVAWSHNSALLVSVSSMDSIFDIWDIEEGHCIKTFQSCESPDQWINSVAWSYDSSFLASASDDKTIKIWSLEKGNIWTLEGHNDQVISIAWSHNSILLASASDDKTIKIWDLEEDNCIKTLEGHNDSVQLVVWSHDSVLLASVSNKIIKIWHQSKGVCIYTLTGHNHQVNSIAWLHMSTLFASASSDNTIKIWDLEKGDCIKILKFHDPWVRSVVWSHDSTLIATISGEKTIKIWDQTNNSYIEMITGHDSSVNSVAWSHDCTLLASASSDKTIKIWDQVDGNCIKTLIGHSSSVKLAVWSADSTLLASASYEVIKIWDRATFQCIETINIARRHIYYLKFHLTDSSILLTNIGRVKIRPIAVLLPYLVSEIISPRFWHDSPFHLPVTKLGYELNSDGTWIMYQGEDLLWLPPEYRPGCSAISGSSIAIGCRSGQICFFVLKAHLLKSGTANV